MSSKGNCTTAEVSIEELDQWIQKNKGKQTRHNRFWTPEEDAILLKYYKIVPMDMLMKHLPGRSKHAIESRASHHGLKKR